MATFAIGDVHGNRASLRNLIRQLEPLIGAGDTVVFLGDIIDRGPDTRGCVEAVLDLSRSSPARVVAVRGNHEDWMLRTLQDPTRHSWLLGMEAFPTIESYSPAAAAVLSEEVRALGIRLITEKPALPYEVFFDSVSREHLEFFRSLRAFVRTPDCVCVHGGLDPAGGPPEGQKEESLLWGGDGFPEAYGGPDVIAYGHANDPVIDEAGWPRPRIVGQTYGLDTISHGVLSAIRFPDLRIFQSRRQE